MLGKQVTRAARQLQLDLHAPGRFDARNAPLSPETVSKPQTCISCQREKGGSENLVESRPKLPHCTKDPQSRKANTRFQEAHGLSRRTRESRKRPVKALQIHVEVCDFKDQAGKHSLRRPPLPALWFLHCFTSVV